LLYALALAHAVVPLVARRLQAIGARANPAAGLANREAAPFSKHLQVSALRGAYLERRLGEVLCRLSEAGIRALVFKGPALARFAYGDLAARGFADLDLLCHPADVPRAVEALARLDYRGDPPLERWRLEKAIPLDCQYALERREGEVRVEIHWGVVRPPFGARPDFDRLWEGRVPVAADGFEIPSPSPRDLFVLLAVHGYKHRWSRLGWVADLAWLAGAVERSSGGWPAVEAAGRELGFAVEIDLARELLRRAGGGSDHETDSPRVRRLADTVERHHFPPAGEPGATARLAFHLAGRPALIDRLKHLAALLWTPALDDLAAPRLPRSLFPLYYPLRPFLLLLKRRGGER
jgi:hypothetical protein